MPTQLSPAAKKTLTRIADIMLPANGEFPSFSQTGSIEHIDELTAYAPDDDIGDLSMVLTLLSVTPGFVLRWLVRKMEGAQHSEGMLAGLFRQLGYGLRGLIYSCYYSEKMGKAFTGKKPLDVIGYEIKRVE